MYNLIEFERKLGPKGQVVIPKEIRRILKLKSSSKVFLTLDENNIILKSKTKNRTSSLRDILKMGKPIEKIDLDSLYNEKMQRRVKNDHLFRR